MNSQRQLNGPGGPGDRPSDVLSRPARQPDLVVRYGDDPDHVADVHLPPAQAGERDGGERCPFTIFLHGGFWRAQYGRDHTRPLAEALAAAGFVVCAPEYRRTGQEGGGWPGTFDDVAAAVDQLPGLVAEATGELVDPGRVILAGHSAGGHLALWAASRHQLPAGSPWRTDGSGGPAGSGAAVGSAAAAGSGIAGVVALAAVSDLATCQRRALGSQAAGALMGGGYGQFPDRYAVADPIELVPAGVPVRLVHGTADDVVPSEMSMSYAVRARSAGATGAAAATCVLLPGTGHFELIDPLSAEWPQVANAFMLLAR